MTEISAIRNLCRLLCLTIVLQLATGMASTAQQVKKELRNVYLRVDSVFMKNDSLVARIDGGREIGVTTGMLGNFYNAVSDENDLSLNTGYGTITALGDDKAECRVLNVYDKAKSIKEGDFLLLKMEMPVRQYPDIFYDLALLGIKFTDMEKRPLFSLGSLLHNDKPGSEDSLKQRMAGDIRYTYEKVKNRTNLPETITRTLPSGRYKGKTTMEVLRDVEMSDLNSFLLYVKTYPAKYIGYIFRASESFAGWVSSNGPYSYVEVERSLLPVYQDREGFQKLLPVYIESFIIENGFHSLIEETESLADDQQMAEAYKVIGLALAIADAVNDNNARASVHYRKAAMDQENAHYADAVNECDSALRYALLCVDVTSPIYADCKTTEIKSLLTKAFCQYKTSLYNEAENTLASAEKKLTANKNIIGDAAYKENARLRYEYGGLINYAASKYNLAISNFQQAVQINRSANNLSAKVVNAYYYKFLGKIYSGQGKYNNAFAMLDSAIDIYSRTSDYRNMALALNEKGSAYYDAGDYKKSIQILQKADSLLIIAGDYNNAGYSLSLIGNSYWSLGNYKMAIEAHEKAIARRKAGNNPEGQAYSWRMMGQLYELSGQKNFALSAYDSAAAIYSDVLFDDIGKATSYTNKGRVYYNDENYKKAVEFYKKATALLAQPPVETLYELGNAFLLIDTAEARKNFEWCERISKSREAGDKKYQFKSLLALADLSSTNNYFAQSAGYYRQAAAVAKEIPALWTEAYLLNSLAYKSFCRVDFDSSLFYYRKALALNNKIDKSGSINNWLSIGSIETSKGRFREAEIAYKNAIALSDSVSSSMGLGISLNSLSFLYTLMGEYKKGISINDSAAAIFLESGNLIRLANTYSSRAALYNSAGNFKAAVITYLQADSIFREEKTNEFRGVLLNNIGVVYFHQANYEKAVDYFTQSAAWLRPGVLDETYFLNRGNLAECYYYLNRSPEAASILKEVFPLAKARKINRIGTSMALVLGQIYFDSAQLDCAIDYLQQAKEMSFASGEKERMMQALVYLGKTEVARNNSKSAEDYFKKAVTIAKQSGTLAGSWEIFYEKGLFYYNLGNYDSAIVNFKEATSLVEGMAANLYGDETDRKKYMHDARKVDLYNKIIAAFIAKGDKTKAAEYSIRSSETAVNSKYGSGIDLSDPAKKADFEKLDELRQESKALDRSIDNAKASTEKEALKSRKKILEDGYQNYINELKKRYADFDKSFSKKVNPESFSSYKGRLPDSMAMVLYTVNDNQLIIFVVTNEVLEIDTTTLKEDINVSINRLISRLSTPDSASRTGPLKLRADFVDEIKDSSHHSFTEVSENLYQLLIGSISKDIKDMSQLCIIPNGKLSYIPFQCLGRRMPDSSFRFLIEDKTIFYTNTLDIFLNQGSGFKTLPDMAAFGNPDTTLSYAGTEVADIKNIIGSATIYLKDSATEAKAKQSLVQNSYVHFATHGTLDYINPLQSYLTFSRDPSAGDDGKLTIAEIDSLVTPRRFAELVTLSACETATPLNYVNDWYVSPANSFLRKHFKSVVATLWKVNDEATSILMTEFYKNLATMDKAEALRRAQATLSHNPRYAHPFYWGAFVLYGYWR